MIMRTPALLVVTALLPERLATAWQNFGQHHQRRMMGA
jgi:hypothetical protein